MAYRKGCEYQMNSEDYPYRHLFKQESLREQLHPESSVRLNPEELAQLIPAAQHGNPEALDRLRRGFVLLIFDLTKKDYIYSTLGVDAVNIAWEAFLSLVMSYKGDNFLSFPGLAKRVILDRLYKAIKKQEAKAALQTSYEQAIESGHDYADPHNNMSEFLEQEALRNALQQLSLEQQQIIYNTLFLEQSLAQQAKTLGQSTRTLRRKYQNALQQLRKILGNSLES